MLLAQRRRQRRQFWDILAILLCLSGLYWFAASFFLAKRTLAERSSCDEAAELLEKHLGLTKDEIRLLQDAGILTTGLPRGGCWMNRVVDSLVILVVDALRFDFAYYNLPNSVGRRLKEAEDFQRGRAETETAKLQGQQRQLPGSRLFQFVADPPTVTMQRLKALTTGGLPTFADISANFGGATVEEDSWIELMSSTDWKARGQPFPSRMGFVGDDTWEDLFPGFFDESFPYPSFNTRDLDTVDNGCMSHIPHLLQRIRKKKPTPDDLEVMVVHFLGVDHVGHTYGPHNEHMDAKLRQMDSILTRILDNLDKAEGCHVTYIFGDHGMTEDGNHGGGTPEEMNAALFVHSSPDCGNMYNSLQLEQDASSDLIQEADFSSIHQIDLVPTIATLLGIPIPYANLGSFVPSLVAGQDVRHATAALALNAAQVWRYFTVYSETANKLPNLQELGDKLAIATSIYKEALASTDVVDTDLYQRAASLFKIFLREALELGQRVWTRFDTVGMAGGIGTLCLGLLVYTVQSCQVDDRRKQKIFLAQFWELFASAFFMAYQCGMLTFSNSYIMEEERSIMFSLCILSLLVAFRLWSGPAPPNCYRAMILLPIAARLNETLVSGHGLDPSIPLHGAHNSIVFLGSLLILGVLRWNLYKSQIIQSYFHCLVDCLTLVCVAGSWWEKRLPDPERDGYFLCRIALGMLFTGIPFSVLQAFMSDHSDEKYNRRQQQSSVESDLLTILVKVYIAIVIVTGPSTATSLVLYSTQAIAIYSLSKTSAALGVHPLVIASLWKFVTRHIFFATNHGCAFNRLQYSAAFIATTEFYFVTGGISLFLNTFGWELAGLAFAWILSEQNGRKSIWRIYGILQLIEAICSCLSVSVLRRHLMVWDIFAPHFLFTAIFTVLNLCSQLTVATLAVR